jgi:hypothetical protein
MKGKAPITRSEPAGNANYSIAIGYLRRRDFVVKCGGASIRSASFLAESTVLRRRVRPFLCGRAKNSLLIPSPGRVSPKEQGVPTVLRNSQPNRRFVTWRSMAFPFAASKVNRRSASRMQTPEIRGSSPRCGLRDRNTSEWLVVRSESRCPPSSLPSTVWGSLAADSEIRDRIVVA